jgi:hypothetical protein
MYTGKHLPDTGFNKAYEQCLQAIAKDPNLVIHYDIESGWPELITKEQQKRIQDMWNSTRSVLNKDAAPVGNIFVFGTGGDPEIKGKDWSEFDEKQFEREYNVPPAYDEKKQKELFYSGKTCPYCSKPTLFTDSAVIYHGRSYGMIYLCKPCDAYVGVHKGTDKALGRLANADLRHWKKEAHKYFDLIWQKGLMKRTNAYSWLSKQLSIDPEYTHIGMFDVYQCKATVEASKQLLNDNRRLDMDMGAEPPTPYFE